jgi:hypothetical protein
VAERNGTFKLEFLRFCRAVGHCQGDWTAYVDGPDMSLWDKASNSPLNTPAQRLQIAKDFACGYASRLSYAPKSHQ